MGAWWEGCGCTVGFSWTFVEGVYEAVVRVGVGVSYTDDFGAGRDCDVDVSALEGLWGWANSV